MKLKLGTGLISPGIINPSSPTGIDPLLKDLLVSWWDLDEISGTRYDAHGSNDLTDINTVVAIVGKINNGVRFNSTDNDSLEKTSPTTLLPSGSFTVAVWYNHQALQWNSRHATGIFSTGDDHRHWVLQWLADTYSPESPPVHGPVFAVSSSGTAGSTVSVGVTSAPAANAWHFLVCWYDAGLSTINIRIDDSYTQSRAFTGPVYQTSPPAFRIGERVDAGVSADSYVDSTAFWGRVLTANEITWLYNSGNGREYADL